MIKQAVKIILSLLFGGIFAAIAFSIWKDNVTAIFIGVILGSFIYFFQEILRLIVAYYKFSKTDKTNLLESLADSKLYDIVESYKKTIHIEINKSLKTNIPMEFYDSPDEQE